MTERIGDVLEFHGPFCRQTGRTTALAELAMRQHIPFVVLSDYEKRMIERRFPGLVVMVWNRLRGYNSKFIFDHRVYEMALAESRAAPRVVRQQQPMYFIDHSDQPRSFPGRKPTCINE